MTMSCKSSRNNKKRRFKSKRQAVQFASTREMELTPYYCWKCGSWHLTSLKKRNVSFLTKVSRIEYQESLNNALGDG